MASGFQATPGQFLEGVISTPPWELVRSALAQKQTDFDNTVATTDLLRQQLQIQHLPTQEAEVAAGLVKDSLNKEIDDVVNNMYKDPNANYSQALKNIQNKLLQSRQQGGDIYKLEYPVKYLQKKKESDAWKEAAKKGYSSYGEAINWYMNELQGKSGLESDFKNPVLDDILSANYDFQKLAKNTKDILEASKKSVKRDSQSGMYILTNGMEVEELSYDKVLGAMLSQLKLDSNYNLWATQKDKHSGGRTNYSNYQDWLKPSFVQDGEGNIKLDSNGTPRVTYLPNEDNSLINAVGSIARGMSYYNTKEESGIRADGAKIAKFNQANINQRHAASLAQADRHHQDSMNLNLLGKAIEANKLINNPNATPEQKAAGISTLEVIGKFNPDIVTGFNNGGTSSLGDIGDGVYMNSTGYHSIDAIKGSQNLNNEVKINMVQKGLQGSLGVDVENHPYFKKLATNIVNKNLGPSDVKKLIEADIRNAATTKNGKSNLHKIPSVLRPYAEQLKRDWASVDQAKKDYRFVATNTPGGLSMGANAQFGRAMNIDKTNLENNLNKIVTDGFFGKNTNNFLKATYPGNIPSVSQTYSLGTSGSQITKDINTDSNISSQFSIFVDGINVGDKVVKGDPNYKIVGDVKITDNKNYGIVLTGKTASGKVVTLQPSEDSEYAQRIVYKHFLAPGSSLNKSSIANSFRDKDLKLSKMKLDNLITTEGSTIVNQSISVDQIIPQNGVIKYSNKGKGYKVNVYGDNTNGFRAIVLDKNDVEIYEKPFDSKDALINNILELTKEK